MLATACITKYLVTASVLRGVILEGCRRIINASVIHSSQIHISSQFLVIKINLSFIKINIVKPILVININFVLCLKSSGKVRLELNKQKNSYRLISPTSRDLPRLEIGWDSLYYVNSCKV